LKPDRSGVYRTAGGGTVNVGTRGIHPGDILHFGQQVSVFYEDRGARGILDADDLCFQSWGKTPQIVSIRDCGFFQLPLQAMRWDFKD
jgi:hypothetical protein